MGMFSSFKVLAEISTLCYLGGIGELGNWGIGELRN